MELEMKIKIHKLLILALVVTFFQLLTPNGKILFTIGSFKITLGSLKAGLIKSGILIFLQLISKLIISLKINFHGKAGLFLKDVFFIYDKLTDDNFIPKETKNLTSDKYNSQIPHKANKITAFMTKLDDKLLSIWEQI